MTTTQTTPKHDIADASLAAEGRKRIEWAERNMPVLAQIRERFEKSQPFAGVRISACMHVTTETANLMRVLKAGGAEIALCASNPLSTQDDTAAALVHEYGISVFARNAVDRDGYYSHINAALDIEPHQVFDDGCDLVNTLHTTRRELLPTITGGCEETTTGVIRLNQMAKDGALTFPMIAVNDTDTKHMFDNRYGTGQSTLDAVFRATNFLLAGRIVVVAGFGYCGKGVAERAKGMGADVVVTEIDPTKALDAMMQGFRVMPMLAKKKNAKMRHQTDEYVLADGRRLLLLAEGRLVNLGAAEGHPASVMDMSFSDQALTAEYLVKEAKNLSAGVHMVPEYIDKEVASLKLISMGGRIDVLTPAQDMYLNSWEHGS